MNSSPAATVSAVAVSTSAAPFCAATAADAGTAVSASGRLQRRQRGPAQLWRGEGASLAAVARFVESDSGSESGSASDSGSGSGLSNAGSEAENEAENESVRVDTKSALKKDAAKVATKTNSSANITVNKNKSIAAANGHNKSSSSKAKTPVKSLVGAKTTPNKKSSTPVSVKTIAKTQVKAKVTKNIKTVSNADSDSGSVGDSHSHSVSQSGSDSDDDSSDGERSQITRDPLGRIARYSCALGGGGLGPSHLNDTALASANYNARADADASRGRSKAKGVGKGLGRRQYHQFPVTVVWPEHGDYWHPLACAPPPLPAAVAAAAAAAAPARALLPIIPYRAPPVSHVEEKMNAKARSNTSAVKASALAVAGAPLLPSSSSSNPLSLPSSSSSLALRPSPSLAASTHKPESTSQAQSRLTAPLPLSALLRGRGMAVIRGGPAAQGWAAMLLDEVNSRVTYRSSTVVTNAQNSAHNGSNSEATMTGISDSNNPSKAPANSTESAQLPRASRVIISRRTLFSLPTASAIVEQTVQQTAAADTAAAVRLASAQANAAAAARAAAKGLTSVQQEKQQRTKDAEFKSKGLVPSPEDAAATVHAILARDTEPYCTHDGDCDLSVIHNHHNDNNGADTASEAISRSNNTYSRDEEHDDCAAVGGRCSLWFPLLSKRTVNTVISQYADWTCYNNPANNARNDAGPTVTQNGDESNSDSTESSSITTPSPTATMTNTAPKSASAPASASNASAAVSVSVTVPECPSRARAATLRALAAVLRHCCQQYRDNKAKRRRQLKIKQEQDMDDDDAVVKTESNKGDVTASDDDDDDVNNDDAGSESENDDDDTDIKSRPSGGGDREQLWSSSSCRAWLYSQSSRAVSRLRRSALRWLWRHGLGPSVHAAVAALLGRGFQSRGVRCVFSDPHTAIQTPHRDTVAVEVNCFTALTSLTPRSGASCFYPGSHNTLGGPHDPLLDSGSNNGSTKNGSGSSEAELAARVGLCSVTGRSAQSPAVQFPLRPGDCVVFNSTLGHYGSDSRELRPMGFMAFRGRARMRAPTRRTVTHGSHGHGQSASQQSANQQSQGQGKEWWDEWDYHSQEHSNTNANKNNSTKSDAAKGKSVKSVVSQSSPSPKNTSSNVDGAGLSSTPESHWREWGYDINNETHYHTALHRAGRSNSSNAHSNGNAGNSSSRSSHNSPSIGHSRGADEVDTGASGGGWRVPVGLRFDVFDPRFPIIFKNNEGDSYSV